MQSKPAQRKYYSPSEPSFIKPLSSALRRIEGDQRALIENVKKLSISVDSRMNRDEAQKVVSWICPSSADGAYSSLHSALSHRTLGTGSWFLNSDSFRDWRDSKAGTIWITGLPGSGKTMLCSTIIEYLRMYSSRWNAVFFFFCDHRDQSKITHNDFVATIVKQTLDVSSACFSHIQQEFEDASRQPFDHRHYVPLIKELMSSFQEIFFVLDALDEASERVEIAETLVQLHAHGQSLLIPTRVLLTSRFDVQLERRHPSITSSRVTLAENMREDIDQYIQRGIETRLAKGSLKVRQQQLLPSIQRQISTQAGT